MNDQERLVESYLLQHPWSTIVAIREGIATEHGIQIERVQARLDRIALRRVLEKAPAEHGRTAYRLGKARPKHKALGIEARIFVVDGTVTVDVRSQVADLDSTAIAECTERLRAAIEASLKGKVVPLVETEAKRQGILQEEDPLMALLDALD